MASSDAKSKWDAKTQALFKHRPLSSLRKKLKGVKRREDKDKPSVTTTTTPMPDQVTMQPMMPIVPFDSIYAAASQASYVPPLFDPMAQYLPPPPSFMQRASGPSMLAPIATQLAGNPIYLVIPKHPALPHPSFDPLNALPSALIAHMAQLHYDMFHQNRAAYYNNDESDPRETTSSSYPSSRNIGESKGRSKYLANREKDGDLRRSEGSDAGASSPIGQEININSNSHPINSGNRHDRISDRAGNEKKEFGFGFPGREIDTRDGDLHHSDYNGNSNSINNDERDNSGSILPPVVTTPLPDGHNDSPRRNGGHLNDHHDHHDHHISY